VIGFLNAARFTGGATGAMIATSILAVSNLPILYFSISFLMLVALVGFKVSFQEGQKGERGLFAE